MMRGNLQRLAKLSVAENLQFMPDPLGEAGLLERLRVHFGAGGKADLQIIDVDTGHNPSMAVVKTTLGDLPDDWHPATLEDRGR